MTALVSGLTLVAMFSTATFVPLEAPKDDDGLDIFFVDDSFDPDKYVEGIWADRVLPHVAERAADLTAVVEAIAADVEAAGEQYGYRELPEGNPWNFLVKGEGVIAAVNTESRNGTVEVDVDGIDAATKIILQVGPVIKGTSVRDSLDFIRFGDFVNQLEFARLSNALNARVRAGLADLDLTTLVGSRVSFAGATTPASGETMVITPVRFSVSPP